MGFCKQNKYEMTPGKMFFCFDFFRSSTIMEGGAQGKVASNQPQDNNKNVYLSEMWKKLLFCL